MSSQSSSCSSVPATQKRVKPIVVASQSKKRSTPASHHPSQKAKTVVNKIKFTDMPQLDVDSIYWTVPTPGYGNPINLASIPENTGKVFVRWLSWEKPDRIGYTLWDKYDAKYWADAASIHMLSQAKLAGLDFDSFYYVVYKQKKELKYGFVPREYIPREKMIAFEQFKHENMKDLVPGGYVPKPEPVEEEGEENDDNQQKGETDEVIDDDDQTATAQGNIFPPSASSNGF